MLWLVFTGGIDERVCTILTLCREKKVQVVHAMSRKRLAFILKKKYMIGCVGIFSYDGAEVHACACMSQLKPVLRYIYHKTFQTQAGVADIYTNWRWFIYMLFNFDELYIKPVVTIYSNDRFYIFVCTPHQN